MMTAVYALTVNVDGNVGRALLVAALLLSTYVLVRYWRSLAERPGKVRYALVSLRAVTLVLMSCALAGARLEYESSARARVLMRSASGESAVGEGQRPEAQSHQRTMQEAMAALQQNNIDVVEAGSPASLSGDFVAGVLLTDGAMTAERAEREIDLTSIAAGSAPVFVLTSYSALENPSVALTNVVVGERAVRGVPFPVRCTVHARGMQGRVSLVTLSDDAKVQASARVAWVSDDEWQTVTVSVVPKVAGWIDYSAKVEASGGEAAELLNRAFTVYAEERRLRVLFFESEPTWEAKFIRRALEQSGLFEVDYLAQVSRSATVGISEEAGRQRDEEMDAEPREVTGARKTRAVNGPGARLHAALQSSAALNAYDTVIVGATENGLLSPAESERLGEWVTRRGGGLVVLGGNSFNGSIVAPGGRLYRFLPAEIAAPKAGPDAREVARGRPLEAEKTRGSVPLTPTEAGADCPLNGFLSASEGVAKAGTLSGDGLSLGLLRPGATVIAVAGQPGANGTSESGASLIAAMRYGVGRTLVFAPADSWRIRTSASGDADSADSPFNALWQGLVLWTGAGAHTPAEIALSDESPAEGSIITAEIRVRDASFAPLKIDKLNARVRSLSEAAGAAPAVEGQPREIAFAPDMFDTSLWRARFSTGVRGRFVLETEYVAGGRSGAIDKHFAVVDAQSNETGAALDTLRRASRESGGEFLSSPSALFERLTAVPSGTQRVRRTWELRSWWPLALLVPLLLSAEWFARRWWKID